MKYYRLDRILEKDAVYNFIYGGRASGKSYAMAEKLLDDYINKGEQFVRVFRNSISKRNGETYFAEVILDNPEKYKDYKVTYDMNKYYINGEVFGYAVALSMEQYKKSEQYPLCTKVVFEEFTALDNEDYWDSEIEHFKSLLSTIFRHRTGKVFFIGNSLTLSNPYFDWLGIDATGIEIGDCKSFTPVVIVNGAEELGASIAIEYVPIGYETAEEIPTMMRVPDNEIATSGAILESNRVHKKYRSYYIGDVFLGMEIDCKEHYPVYAVKTCVWEYNGHRYNIAQTSDGIVFVQGEFAGMKKLDIYSENMYQSYCKEDLFLPCNIDISMQFPVEAPDGDITVLTKKKAKKILFADQWSEYHYTVDRADVKENAEFMRKLRLGDPLTELDSKTKFISEKYNQDKEPFYSEEDLYELLLKKIVAEILKKHDEAERAEQAVSSGNTVTVKIGNSTYKIPEADKALLYYIETNEACFRKKGRTYTCRKLDDTEFRHLARLTATKFKAYKEKAPK